MPSVLSPAEITELRALVVSFFPDTCQVIAVTHTNDGRGGSTLGTAAGAAQPCKLRTTGYRPTEQLLASRITNAEVYALDLAFGATIAAKDRVLVNGTRTMEVIGIIEGGTEAMQTTAIVAERSV